MDNDINYEEIFGLTAEETDPAPAQPEETPEEPGPQSDPEETSEEQPKEQPEEQPKEQTREERSRQAFGRRIREAEEWAAQAATKAAEQQFNAMLARMGIEDPETNEALNSLEKFAAYDQRKSDERLKTGKANEGDIKRIIQSMQQAPQPRTDADPRLQAELDLIASIDPKMTGLGAILASEIGPSFRDHVQKGESFVKAYTNARKELQSKAGTEAAAKAKAASKGHLNGTKTGTEGEVPVPRDEMVYFRAMMPNATDAEIQKYYNEDRKRHPK